MTHVESVGNCLGIEQYVIPYHSIGLIYTHENKLYVEVTYRTGGEDQESNRETLTFSEENEKDLQKTFSLIKSVLREIKIDIQY